MRCIRVDRIVLPDGNLESHQRDAVAADGSSGVRMLIGIVRRSSSTADAVPLVIAVQSRRSPNPGTTSLSVSPDVARRAAEIASSGR